MFSLSSCRLKLESNHFHFYVFLFLMQSIVNSQVETSTVHPVAAATALFDAYVKEQAAIRPDANEDEDYDQLNEDLADDGRILWPLSLKVTKTDPTNALGPPNPWQNAPAPVPVEFA